MLTLAEAGAKYTLRGVLQLDTVSRSCLISDNKHMSLTVTSFKKQGRSQRKPYTDLSNPEELASGGRRCDQAECDHW